MKDTHRASTLLAALVAFATLACGSPTPVEPSRSVAATPTPRPTPAPPFGTWTVTMTVTEATGSFCINLPATGASWTVLYTIQGFATATMTFAGPDIEWNMYTVAVDGLSFQSAPFTFSQTVGCAAYVYSTRLAGTFSADRNGFTATEWDTYTLDTGEVVSRTWAWSGKRN